MGTIENVKEMAILIKKLGDLDLYRKILDLQGEIVDLTEAKRSLEEENRELKKQLEFGNKMQMRGPHGYFFQEGDEVPFCPKCWESDGKAIHLPAPVDSQTFGLTRTCRVCQHRYTESPAPPRTGGRQLGGTWS